jgi:hypothetical protein
VKGLREGQTEGTTERANVSFREESKQNCTGRRHVSSNSEGYEQACSTDGGDDVEAESVVERVWSRVGAVRNRVAPDLIGVKRGSSQIS